ncbi:MAG: SGNH/GDSL hydrolase family protein [Mycobacteriales bacterium]
MARKVSLERPLSVVVVGNSLTVLSLPGRTGADDGLYAEVLRDRLVAAGVPTRVHVSGRWFDFATSALRRYQQDVRAHLPDVVVIQYGLNESQPWLFPVPLLRHLMTQQSPHRPTGRWYRERLQPVLWKRVRQYRRWASGVVGTRTWQTTPKRFASTLQQLIRATRHDSRPLVLVLDVDPPSPALTHFLQGMPERHDVVQQVLRDVVAGFDDPEVRLVEVSRIREQAGPEASADGMHYTPYGHRVIGEALAEEVLRWL